VIFLKKIFSLTLFWVKWAESTGVKRSWEESNG